MRYLTAVVLAAGLVFVLVRLHVISFSFLTQPLHAPKSPVVVRQHPMYRILNTPPESQYEASLEAALRYSAEPEAMAQICAQWFPEYDRAVVDGWKEWRDRNVAVYDDLRERSKAVWERRAGSDIKYVKMVYPHIRKEISDGLMAESDRRPVEDFKQSCRKYPEDMRAARWNLEKQLWVELSVIRARPRSTPST